jgi:putative addiction module killer protein
MNETVQIKVKITEKNGKSVFKKWFAGLENKAKTQIIRRFAQVTTGNLGDHKYLREKVSELRFRDGHRIYYTMISPDMLLLLGGTKSSQNRDIERAIKWLKELEK